MNKLSFFILTFVIAMIVSFVFTVALLNGCSLDRFIKIEAGNYEPVNTESMHDSPVVDLISGLYIDRQNNNVELSLKNGLVIRSTFIARPKQNWPSGCPANLGSTRMEVLDIEEDVLAIGDIKIVNPILVRNCPDDPERVILREDGQIGGSGTACAHDEKCFHFKKTT